MAAAMRNAVPSSKVGSGTLAGDATVCAGPEAAALAFGWVWAAAGPGNKVVPKSTAATARISILGASALKPCCDIQKSPQPTRIAPTTGAKGAASVLPKRSEMLPAPRCFCFVGAGRAKVHRPNAHDLPENYGRLMDGIMRPLLFIAAAMTVLAAAISPAVAQSRNPVFTADREACFGRVYDRAHMASHPDQKAISIHVFRALGHRAESEKWYPGQRDEEIKRFRESGDTSVAAFVTFRDRRGYFRNTLNCNKEDQDGVLCAIFCDGGSFKLKREYANATMLVNHGFVLVGGCGGEDVEESQTVHFSPGKDDKLFRLETKPLSACLAEAQKSIPIPPGKPLRERFKEDEAFCFGRDYDRAHLGSHPQQMVAS